MLPVTHEAWGHALEAELPSVPIGLPRIGFAFSGAAGLCIVVVHDAMRGRIADAPAVGLAACMGVLAAFIDLTVDSRAPGASMIALVSVTLGAWCPRAMWRWPLLTGGMLPLVIAISGNAGPYAFDPGDQYFAVALAIVATLLGAAGRWTNLRILGHFANRRQQRCN